MQKIYLYFLVLLSPFITFSQDFTASAEQETRIDEYGNALNNVTDKQDLKQGDWFYVDINGNQVAKKVYENNQCLGTYLLIDDSWVNVSSLITNTKHKYRASGALESENIELNQDRQVLLILDETGNFVVSYLLGEWVLEDQTIVDDLMKKYFTNPHLQHKFNSKIYILL